MGGMNSGRRATTPDTDDCLQLSLTYLRREGMLRRHQMARKVLRCISGVDVLGEITVVADLECLEPSPCLRITGWALGKRIDQRLEIVGQPQPFGGERFYAVCPRTGRRATALYLPPGRCTFASARGWGVPYASTREREVDRALRMISRTEAQLSSLSNYARRPTWERIEDRWMRAHSVVDAYEERLLRRW